MSDQGEIGHDRIGMEVDPAILGSYKILRLLGQGGFARVYLGEHKLLDTAAAIKVLHLKVTKSLWQDFYDEAHTIAHLKHNNIVRVLDFGLEDDVPFLVMDYAQEGSLRQRHPVGSVLALNTILSYVQQVAAALHYAHSQNVVHCDVKPENLLIGDQQTILLSDFGLATVAQYRPTQNKDNIAGTPIYMAPEQIQGNAQTASDQYALACLVYEWLCGEAPFTGSHNMVIKQHLYLPPTPLRARGIAIAEGIDKVVLRALAKDPQQRFTDILAFAEALAEACQQERISTVAEVEERHATPTTSSSALSTITSPHSSTPVFPEPYPTVWNVDYRRNPFFTGREEVITYLHNAFSAVTGHMAQALTGLSGIGKTQAAIEYAYRFRSHYQAIFWATADSHTHLVADFTAIAALLNLPEQHEANEECIVQAVKRWLQQQSNWLLILDNVEEPGMLEYFIPPAHRGHILLTTRAQAMGTLAESHEIEKMTAEEGSLFLLRRAGILKSFLQQTTESQRALTMNIVQEMDGLPLALEQAGAYLEETDCGFDEYLTLYRQRRSVLLQLPGQAAPPDLAASGHPTTVATTWSLSFEQVAHTNLAAAELLRLCTFLHADAIPEEIFTARASELGPPLSSLATDRLLFNEAIKELRKYSLIRRNTENKTFSIHRLVQAVLKDRMDAETQRLWSERAVRAVNAVFPAEESKQWQQCERYLPHAQACAELVAQWDMAFPEALQLLNWAGAYFSERSQYSQAKALFTLTLEIWQRHLGPEHPDVAISLYSLAQLYHELGEYSQAEQTLSKVIALRERALGPYHPDLAHSLNLLAVIYKYRGEYDKAEDYYQRALHIMETAYGPDHADVAATLNNLARLYEAQGKYLQAEPLFARTLDICERELGHDDPRTAVLLANFARLYYLTGKYARAETLLAETQQAAQQDDAHPQSAYNLTILGQIYQAQARYQEAEQVFQQAVIVREKTTGAEHPATAQSLCLLASLYLTMGKYTEAEQLLKRALPINEQRMGPEHPNTASNLYLLGKLAMKLARFNDAESFLQRALSIRQQALGTQHPDVAQSFNALARLFLTQARFDLISSYAQQGLHIREQALGPDHPDVADSLLTLAYISLVQGRYAPAHTLCQRALSIQQRVLGEDHPDVAQTLNILANLFLAQDETAQAELCCKKAIAIREMSLGLTHPLLAQSLNTLAEISLAQEKYTLARSLCLQALTIRENLFGSEHPMVAQSLSNIAESSRFLAGGSDAELFFRRAIEIWERTVGREHPDIAITLNNLAQFYEGKGEYKRADSLYSRALTIYRHIKGQAHPDMAVVLENYAALLKKMGREEKAMQLEAQSHKIKERQARQNKAKT